MIKNLKGEEWRYIKGYDNQYAISSMGRFKSLRMKKIVILKQQLSHKGYLRINLFKTSHKHKAFRINRLVAEYFIPNPNNYPHVNHLNGKKIDNCVSNLEWCTPLMNMCHARKLKPFKTRKLSKNMWCEKWQKCVSCGTNKKEHKSHGLCCKCYHYAHYYRKR